MRIHTFAEGLFSKLAHDLELDCEGLRGTLDGGQAVIEAPIESIRVVGTLGKGTLSDSDKRDILEKMRREVFRAERGNVVIEATRDGMRIRVPSGASASLPAPNIEGSADRISAKGSFELSMSSTGAGVVKGPMGAFRVKDRVVVHYDVSFQPA